MFTNQGSVTPQASTTWATTYGAKHDVDIFATVRKDKNSGEMIEDTQWHSDIFLRLTRG